MPDTPVSIYHDLSGISSPILLVYPLAGGAAVNGAGDAVTLLADGEFAWQATIAEALDGIYRYEVTSSGTAIAWGFLALADTTDRCHGEYTRAAAELRGQLVTLLERSARVNGLIEDSDGDRFSAKALETAPTGEGGGGGYTGLTEEEIEAIRDAILDRVLEGSHDEEGTPGKILQDIAEATADLAQSIENINNSLSNGQITTISHQLPGEQILLVRGDSYKASNGRPLRFINESGTGWPLDLTGATIRFTAVKISEAGKPTAEVVTARKIEATGSVHVAAAPNQEVRCELLASQTDREEGVYDYDVEAEFPNGDIHTLVTTAEQKTTSQLVSLNRRKPKKLLEILAHYTQPIPD